MINKNRGLLSGVMSGVLWGLDTTLTGIILNMSLFIKVQKTILLAPFVGVFLHDMFSSLWVFLYIIATKQLKTVLKSLKTRSGRVICMAAILGGPVGMAAYLMAIKYIGAGYTASISAIYPALGSF
ncbi:multidrug resistance efflux transporter family protein [Paraclostridium sordellii]|uniref:multidrug resistance efflux transporter family protein n=1 Tax=Paraclostridium sordellii TaxID=1505 RepID=UPI00038550E1|nr:multidrug resistance efflux transporter family protein [Paeniclostridium sordellii]EPZ62777.1 multidrug resistance efflux transporter family protein [[Clostridium] sordellii VPI 9048] [Paeniclostridium sordellii VPI 9048]CEK39076.1 multidrug resistance efflux transporterfamilyprotein [[Clostridium] sordellii] [Paeniclostridium sordellii]